MDYGPFHGHAINLFVTSRIKHTPYETFLAVYFLFLKSGHAIFRFVASSSRNLDARQRNTISCLFHCVISFSFLSRDFLVTKSRFRLATESFYLSAGHVSNSRDRAFPALSLGSCETEKDHFLRSILNCCCVKQQLIDSLGFSA